MTMASLLIDVIAPLAAAGALLASASSDLTSYQIPNRYAATVALAAMPAGLVAGPLALLLALAMGIGVFAFGAIFFARGWMGGGDVKLLAATALWVPPPLLSVFALSTALAGAVLSIALLTPLRHRLPAPPVSLRPTDGASALRRPVPFGIAIAIGGLVVLGARFSG
jgi:prepilin peptidase CpaA